MSRTIRGMSQTKFFSLGQNLDVSDNLEIVPDKISLSQTFQNCLRHPVRLAVSDTKGDRLGQPPQCPGPGSRRLRPASREIPALGTIQAYKLQGCSPDEGSLRRRFFGLARRLSLRGESASKLPANVQSR
jgi:hypothetical protein